MRKDGGSDILRFEEYNQQHINQDTKIYNLGFIDEHDFIIEETEITTYSLYYDEVKDVEDLKKMYKTENKEHRYKVSNNRFIASYEVVKLLFECKDKLLKPIEYNEEIMITQFYKNITEYSSLEYSDKCINYDLYEAKKTKIFS